MSAPAPTMQAFFTERLIGQRQASPHTIAAYRDTFRLLLAFAQQRTGIEPHALDIDDLDSALVTAFLDHLERDRRQQPAHPQCPAGGGPLALPPRRAAPPRARGHARTGARDPDQTPRPRDRLVWPGDPGAWQARSS